MDKLYYIENCGCDATTRGLVRVPEEHFPKFKEFIENLNKNSTYGCMPTIEVYRISMEQLREFTYDLNIEWGEEGYVDEDYILYFEGKTYTFNSEYVYDVISGLERVI